MENTINSTQQMRRQRFYLVLPLLMLPFLTALYWHWIVKPASQTDPTQTVQGLLTTVPDAVLGKEKAPNKLSSYQKAEQDSAKLGSQIRKDPYRQDTGFSLDSFQTGRLSAIHGPMAGKRAVSGGLTDVTYNPEQQEKQVYQKLRDLDKELAAASEPQFSQPAPPAAESAPEAALQTTDQNKSALRRQLVDLDFDQSLQADPEIEQINGVLDKILAIQDPARAQRVREDTLASVSLPVRADKPPVEPALLGVESGADSPANGYGANTGQQSGFFSLEQPSGIAAQNAIAAEVGQTQTLLTGQVIELRLMQDIYISGNILPRGTLVYGKVSIAGQRLMAAIENIRLENVVLPVKLTVYDLDGLAGIRIPDQVSRQVAKQSLSQDVQGFDITSADGSLAGQAASAGIQTAKTLLSRKTRLVQITLHQGHRVLLVGDSAGI